MAEEDKGAGASLHAIAGGGKADQLLQSIRYMRVNLPQMIEHMTTVAQLQKAKYDALRKEGFDEKQALELCKSLF